MPLTGPKVPLDQIGDRDVYIVDWSAFPDVTAMIIQTGITMDDVLSQEFQDGLVALAEQYRQENGYGLDRSIVCAYRFDVNPDGTPKEYPAPEGEPPPADEEESPEDEPPAPEPADLDDPSDGP